MECDSVMTSIQKSTMVGRGASWKRPRLQRTLAGIDHRKLFVLYPVQAMCAPANCANLIVGRATSPIMKTLAPPCTLLTHPLLCSGPVLCCENFLRYGESPEDFRAVLALGERKPRRMAEIPAKGNF